jgi:hypothetical protein
VRTFLTVAIVCALGLSFTNLLYALALRAAAEVERAVGERRFADVLDERAARVCEAVFRRFWREEAGMLAFSGESEVFCERVRSPVPGTFVWRGRTASVAPGETTFVEMKGERQ